MDPLVSQTPEKLRSSRKDIQHLLRIAETVREKTDAVLTLAVN